MKLWILPDCHGTWGQLMSVLERAKANNVDRILQVGDCGWMWPGEAKDSLSALLKRYEIPFLWLAGNHDNWTKLDALEGDEDIKQSPTDIKQISDYNFYLPRNTYFNLFGLNFYAFGGAESTDFADRSYGWSDSFWRPAKNASIWIRESPSDEDISQLIERTSRLPIDIFLSHDAPIQHRPQRKQLYNPISCRWTDYTSQQLEKAHQNFQVKLWFYGHHHELKIHGQEEVFCCPGIIDGRNRWSSVIRRQWAELSDSPTDLPCLVERKIVTIQNQTYHLSTFSEIE